MTRTPDRTMQKKLLILLSSLSPGGAETQTVRLVNNIDTGKFDITLRYFDKRETLLGDLDAARVESVACLDRKGRFDPAMLDSVKDLIDRKHHDLVLCISPYPLVYGYLVRLLYRRKFKLVTAIHQTLQRPGRWESVKAWIFKTLLNRCDLILFVCKNQLDYWVDKRGVNKDKCRYIYNGIDVDHFSTQPKAEDASELVERYHIDAEDNVLVNVAGFRNEKMQDDIVRAAGKLREQGYHLKVLLVGDGPRRRAIEQLIQSSGLQEHVLVAGLQRDVRPYLHRADCFVISSHQETFSMAALEAMAAGKPIIITDVGGAAEMVEDGENGFLYAPGDVDSLVEKIKTVIDQDLFVKMGDASKRIVSERFTSQKMVREYEEVLSEL